MLTLIKIVSTARCTAAVSVSSGKLFWSKCNGYLVRTLKVYNGSAVLGHAIIRIVFLTSVRFYFIKSTKTAVRFIYLFCFFAGYVCPPPKGGQEATILYLICLRSITDFGNLINTWVNSYSAFPSGAKLGRDLPWYMANMIELVIRSLCFDSGLVSKLKAAAAA